MAEDGASVIGDDAPPSGDDVSPDGEDASPAIPVPETITRADLLQFVNIRKESRSHTAMYVTCKFCEKGMSGTNERMAAHVARESKHSVELCKKSSPEAIAIGKQILANLEVKRQSMKKEPGESSTATTARKSVGGDGGPSSKKRRSTLFNGRSRPRHGETSSGTVYNFTKEATRFEASFAHGVADAPGGVTPITVFTNEADFDMWLGAQSPRAKSWIKLMGQGFYKPGRLVLVPSTSVYSDVAIAEAAFCLGEGHDGSSGSPFALCALYDQLPGGKYSLHRAHGGPIDKPDTAAISWALSGYSFVRYKSDADGGEEDSARKVLVWPLGVNKAKVLAVAASTFLVRDLITTPCEDMGPQHLEAVVRALGEEFAGAVRVVKGEDLLKERDGYPMVHAVGRAAGVGREPRMLDLKWTPPGTSDGNLPKVTLVGKGVCFDTGGLDIKTAAGMLTMKKDMAGGAQVLGLARMIMVQQLPVRLRVLIPAVENSISGDALRPSDVIISRNGRSTEVGNTDAEGRLVLADALADASSESPDLLIDCATLTGASKVALGTDLPAVFCNDESLATKLQVLSGHVHDQVWRLPLWEGYRTQLSSKIADLKNIGTAGCGGAILAALYLEEFVGNKHSSAGGGGGSAGPTVPWIHMDFMAYNQASKPGRPEGGEAQGMRALYSVIEDMFGPS